MPSREYSAWKDSRQDGTPERIERAYIRTYQEFELGPFVVGGFTSEANNRDMKNVQFSADIEACECDIHFLFVIQR